MSSRPLTPPCVPFGTRRFNNLSAVPCISGICHHITLMQGIRLLMTYAKYGCWIFSNNPFCCSPTPGMAMIDTINAIAPNTIIRLPVTLRKVEPFASIVFHSVIK